MGKPDGSNPQEFQGCRNLECPHYLCCLDQAVHLSWQTFSCQHCSHQKLRQPLRAENMDLEAPGWEDIWAQAGWEG
jgi:hypothetical protein